MNAVWRRFAGIWRSPAYRQYLARRGYGEPSGWSFAQRAFIECWAQPGFHRFWRVWNPGLGFLTFRLYRLLGGNRSGLLAKVIVFLASGLVHSVLVLPFLGWSLTIPVTFTCFGVLVVASQVLSRVLRQDRWPPALNLLVNVALVLGSFELGFRVHALLACGSCCP